MLQVLQDYLVLVVLRYNFKLLISTWSIWSGGNVLYRIGTRSQGHPREHRRGWPLNISAWCTDRVGWTALFAKRALFPVCGSFCRKSHITVGGCAIHVGKAHPTSQHWRRVSSQFDSICEFCNFCDYTDNDRSVSICLNDYVQVFPRCFFGSFVRIVL